MGEVAEGSGNSGRRQVLPWMTPGVTAVWGQRAAGPGEPPLELHLLTPGSHPVPSLLPLRGFAVSL